MHDEVEGRRKALPDPNGATLSKAPWSKSRNDYRPEFSIITVQTKRPDPAAGPKQTEPTKTCLQALEGRPMPERVNDAQDNLYDSIRKAVIAALILYTSSLLQEDLPPGAWITLQDH